MAVHALQGRSDDSLLRRRRHERVSPNALGNTPGAESLGQCDVLPRLTQTTVMYLNRFAESLDAKIAFVRKPVAPGTALWPRFKLLQHGSAYPLLVAGSVKI